MYHFQLESLRLCLLGKEESANENIQWLCAATEWGSVLMGAVGGAAGLLGRRRRSEGGYRDTESGLDASFLWSHDKSGEDKGKVGTGNNHLKKKKRWGSMQSNKRGEREERKRS